MIPIQNLLNRIRWDKHFGKARFEIGYYDHVERRIVRIPFKEIQWEEGNHFSFQIRDMDAEDAFRLIPLHRVRAVYRDDVLIWQRTAGEQLSTSKE